MPGEDAGGKAFNVNKDRITCYTFTKSSTQVAIVTLPLKRRTLHSSFVGVAALAGLLLRSPLAMERPCKMSWANA